MVTGDGSAGRFLVLIDQYLDVAIYRSGRLVTVAGEIQEPRTMPAGERKNLSFHSCHRNTSMTGCQTAVL